MAFTNGTLLVSGGDVYTQLMDILKTFMETAGWSTNLYEDYGWEYAGDDYTGKRLHSQKSIGGHTRYINIRSHKNQKIFDTSSRSSGSGIGAIASTGYDGATESVTLNSVSDMGGGTIQFNAVGIHTYVGEIINITGTTDYNGGHTVTLGGNGFARVTATYVSNQSGTLQGSSKWDKQTGFTAGFDPNLTNLSSGCGALDLPADNLSYWLFSQNSDNNIYLICQNSTGYTGIVFGTTSANNYFLSGASHYSGSADTLPNGVLCGTPGLHSGNGAMALRKYDNTSWWDWPNDDGVNDDEATFLKMTTINTVLETSNISSIVQELLYCSPDNFKGNNPLIPSYQGVQIDSGLERIQYNGVVEGIKYVNMKLMDSLTELTFGGDTYILFRLYAADDANDATVGLAMLK